MTMGSWLRFGAGILLSLDVLRAYLTGTGPQVSTFILAVIFLGLAVLYAVKRF